jgi:peptide/nickel transport system substrate-binding protein
MMRPKTLLSTAAAGLLLLSACTGAAPEARSPSAATAPARTDQAGAPQPGGRVVIGSASDAKVLTRVLMNDNVSFYVGRRIYESLISVDKQTGEPLPRLAEKFEVSPDSQTLTFTLRDGVKWSDGSPFSGEDFKFTAEAVMRSKLTVHKNMFQDIVGAKEFGEGRADTITGIRVDGGSRTIKVQLERPFCPALTDMGQYPIIPKSVFGKYMDPKDASKNIDDAPENTAPPIALGAFKFKEWVPNDHITLVRNDDFFGGKPLLDEWVLRVVPDATAVGAALKTGEVDAAVLQNPRDADDLRRADNLNVISQPSLGYTYIGWNMLRGGREFFQSKAVRQALAYGLNMDQVVEKIYFGEGKRLVAHTSPSSWAFDPTGLNPYSYDPQKAQQLLEQDGFSKGPDGIYQKDGQPLEFEIVTNSGNTVRETFLQVAAEQYRQIGVKVNPRTEAFQALVERLDHSRDPKYGDQGGHDFDAVILGWTGATDPDPYSIWHSSQTGPGGNNFVGYKNDTVDKALEDGRTKCSRDERRAAYKVFNTQLNEDQPYNFGVSNNGLIAVNKRIQGVDTGPFPRTDEGLLWNVEKWWIKP